MKADMIHHDQMYTVPGCSMFKNQYLVWDFFEIAHRAGLSFALLSLKQEKAFNREDHRYLTGILRTFKFGPCFVQFFPGAIHLCRVHGQTQLDTDETHPIQTRIVSRLPALRPALCCHPQALPVFCFLEHQPP